MKGKGILAAALLAPAGLLAGGTALADQEERLLDKLVERGVLSQEDVDQIRETPEVIERHPGLDYDPTTPVVPEKVRTRVGRPAWETEDGRHRFGLRGRLMLDYAYVDDPFTTTDDEDADDGDLARYGTIIRRARMGMLGLMYDNWEWQVEVDFRDEEVRFANAYLAYLFDNGRLATGYFKEPWSLESHTSSRRISFIERAAPVDAYRPNPSRAMGVMWESLVPDYYYALGVFGGDGVARNRDVTEGWSIAGRSSFAPYMDASRDIFTHLGASYQYRRNAYEWDRSGGDAKEYESVRKRTRLGTRAVDGRMIGENDMEDVDYYTSWALEAAFGIGPFSMQGEYIRMDLIRDEDSEDFADNPGTDVTRMVSDGWYTQASYFLTGESRNYRAFSGDFGHINVHNPLSAGGPGAWKVLARYAVADSTEHHNREDRQKLKHSTLGLNWYPEDRIVFKLNAMYVDAERGEDGFGDGFKEWSSPVYALRAQYDW